MCDHILLAAKNRQSKIQQSLQRVYSPLPPSPLWPYLSTLLNIDNLNNLMFHDCRFGSLDRRHTRSSSSRSNSSVDHELSVVPVMPRHTNPQHPTTTILLPNQMYPENSLMRTHSLGNIKNENQQQTEKVFTELNQMSLSESRKNSEKKWIETSLDSSSVESGPTLTHDLPPPPPPIKMHTPPIQSENHPLPYDPLVNHFDTVIIF